MARGSDGGTARRESDIQAIKACLDELGGHAESYGLSLAANLIGAASRAIADEIAERRVRNLDWSKHENRLFDA